MESLTAIIKLMGKKHIGTIRHKVVGTLRYGKWGRLKGGTVMISQNDEELNINYRKYYGILYLWNLKLFFFKVCKICIMYSMLEDSSNL